MGARWFAMGKGVANSPERNQHQIDNPELDADTKRTIYKRINTY